MKTPSAFAVCLLTLWTGTARAEAIRGTVLEDHSGASVQAATVRIRTSAGATVKEVETDRNGDFAIPDLPAGVYQVSITKANYGSLNARMAAGNAATAAVLRLIKYGVISGHITSPRRGGTVVAIEQVPRNHLPRSYSGMINPAGEFRIFGIPPGRYVLAAPFTSANTLPGVVRGMALYPTNAKPREFDIAGGEQYEVADFVVQPGGLSTISGTVSSPAGPQIYNVAIVASDYPSIQMQLTLTATDGTFKLDNFHPGSYDLYASGPLAPPSFFAHLRLELNSQNVENLDIRLQPGRAVEFVLPPRKTALNPACSADGTITLQSLGRWPLVRDQKITTPIAPPQVPTRIENLGPTPFVVNVQSTTGSCTGVTDRLLDMTANVPPPRVIMGFQPPGVIHGVAPNASVVILRDVTPGRDAPVQAVFAKAAEFRFEGLPPGQYCVSTQSAGDPTLRWTAESGCGNSVIELAAGESKGL
jgi:hypothetical protein